MRTNKARKAGTPVYTKPQPDLRAVPPSAPRPPAKPEPDLKALLDDRQRRYRVQRERLNLGDDEPEAA